MLFHVHLSVASTPSHQPSPATKPAKFAVTRKWAGPVMPKGQLSRVPWPGSCRRLFTFQAVLWPLQQPHKHSFSLHLAVHTHTCSCSQVPVCMSVCVLFFHPALYDPASPPVYECMVTSYHCGHDDDVILCRAICKSC